MAQETGITRLIPCRDGVLPLNSIAKVAPDFDSVESDYQRHSSATQEIARKYFKATNVLAGSIEKATA
jgi:hypothetical protein